MGLPEALAPIFLAVGTADFDGDAMIWSHRTHLERPRPLKEDGPIVAYRRWSERFWPEGYARSVDEEGLRPSSSLEQNGEPVRPSLDRPRSLNVLS